MLLGFIHSGILHSAGYGGYGTLNYSSPPNKYPIANSNKA